MQSVESGSTVELGAGFAVCPDTDVTVANIADAMTALATCVSTRSMTTGVRSGGEAPSSEVPLLIGVVGSLEDANSAALEAILSDLSDRYPQTPLVLRGAGDDVPRDRIARASDILIVLSGGPASAELRGVVERRRNGEPAIAGSRTLLAPPDVGPCYLIEGTAVQRFFPPRFPGDEFGEPEFAAELARRNRFNVDLRTVGEPAEGTALERLRSRTDAVTNVLQAKARGWQLVLYLIAFLAASVQIITLIPHSGYIKFGAVALAFVVFFFVRRRDYQSRDQDYRAISEALRVQAVWTAVGIEDNVEESYLPMQQTDLQWIRNVLRVLNFLHKRQTSPLGFDVVMDWVTVQHRYFAEHSGIEARRRDVFGKTAGILGVLSLVASLAILGLSIARAGSSGMTLAIGMLAAWMALCVAIAQSYARTRGYSENANRYQRMFFVFDRALMLLKSPNTSEADVRTIAAELGREALAEHAEWLLAQRERRLSLVHTSAA